LFGGDSSSAQKHVSLSVTLFGHVSPGLALRRNGARAGDEIWVTGTIGDAAIGLMGRRGTLENVPAFLIARSQLPGVHIDVALAGIVSAAIDISDGLLQDLGHICQASGVVAEIDASLVPTSPQAASFGDAMLEVRLTGGDDYELLLAVPPENAMALKQAWGKRRITKIGSFSEGPPQVTVKDSNGAKLNFTKPGWQHF
jgi:thiamine-monophosphate kinase